MPIQYDLIIIGGGPAGTAAGVYAARKRLKTLLIAKEFVGQSAVSEDIQNWIGTISISGADLSSSLKKHVEAYADDVLEMREERVEKLEPQNGAFVVITKKASYTTRAVLIATGSHPRKLEAKGADVFEHKGLTYCASCDGPLFAGQDLAVIGGGNAAFETSSQLLAYAKSVTLIHRSADFNRADKITVDKVLSHPNMRAVKNVEIAEVKGEKFVTSIVYRDKATGTTTELPIGGIFIEIGQLPNTEFSKGIVAMNEHNHVIIDARTQKTSVPGIWAAGDCTDVLYHQNNIAVGDAVRALEDIYLAIKAK
ncbi:MAG: Alkyl hydroperoxide reductase [Parcubacteria group bacterium GW2011_GWA1_47_8]|nr:MAG: Alkyl hydroperoxide reductase [Parcubacteria group bacterium GW2011_GWA1_47_8]